MSSLELSSYGERAHGVWLHEENARSEINLDAIRKQAVSVKGSYGVDWLNDVDWTVPGGSGDVCLCVCVCMWVSVRAYVCVFTNKHLMPQCLWCNVNSIRNKAGLSSIYSYLPTKSSLHIM